MDDKCSCSFLMSGMEGKVSERGMLTAKWFVLWSLDVRGKVTNGDH